MRFIVQNGKFRLRTSRFEFLRFERLIEDMKQAQGITECLKAEKALELGGGVNNIRTCAMEIVNNELIF